MTLTDCAGVVAVLGHVQAIQEDPKHEGGSPVWQKQQEPRARLRGGEGGGNRR